MNTRVLELLENPKMIQAEDLALLQKEISTYPYVQNIRALHLYGVHLYDKENYQKALSSTAAYTTDKKILYQFINGKSAIISSIESIKEDIKNSPSTEPIKEDAPTALASGEIDTETCEAQSEKSLKSNSLVIINGEVNRILFEGEEAWFEETIAKPQQEHQEDIVVEKLQGETEILDNNNVISGQILEETQELQEEIVVEKPQEEIETLENNEVISEQILEEAQELQEENVVEELQEEVVENNSEIVSKEILTEEEDVINNSFSPKVPNSETLIDEDVLGHNNIEEIINKETELSFHATDSFLPEVKIESQSPQDTIKITEVTPKLNKHEEEIKRLVEEVEMKLKAKKAKAVSQEKKEVPQQIVNTIEKIELPIKEEAIETTEEINSSWKPMDFENSVPDALLSKVQVADNINVNIPSSIDESMTEPNEKEKEIEENKEVTSSIISPSSEEETHPEEISSPVINVSFFPKEISNIKLHSDDNKEIATEINKLHTEEEKIVKEEPKEESSNVKGFISTWQSWLKIDRPEQKIASEQKTPKVPTEKIEEIKNKAIDSFIENNPRISQLKDKEDVNFVVKEKKKDISHLMTETLANLYVEQKLYAQAIKAFKALIVKHPEKRAHFEKRIKEVQENRNKN